jgi:hypothetical protein
MSEWVESISEDLTVIELCRSGKDHEPGKPGVHYLAANDFSRFKTGTPGAFLVDETGTILSPPVAGSEELEALVRATLN